LFAVTSTATGCAILLLAASGAASAADQPAAAVAPAPIEEIVVTGIRAAIESAINIKKNSDSIVEAISSEDIGKLPDTSVAESLARLPGVAAQRTAGRDQQISIRGLAPDFTTGLLNGREQVSTGDSRSVQYDQYPSELVSAVTVYKTPDGALVGQGLAGTVDIQTVRPLNLKGPALAVNYRKEKLGVGTLAEGDGKRMSLSVVDQFFDHKLGVALGFARLDDNGATTQRFESWGGGTTHYPATGDATGAPTGPVVNVPYNGFNIWSDQTVQRRDGAMAVLQFQPNESYSTSLDLFYAKFESTTATKGFQAPLNDNWGGVYPIPPATNIPQGNYDTGGLLVDATLSGSDVTSGTFNNVRAVVRNDADHTVDKLNSYAWRNTWTGTAWTTALDLAYSRALKDGQHLETTAGTAQSTLGTAQLDSVGFTAAGVFTPGLDYTDRSIVKLTDVQGWGGGTATPQAGYSKLPNVEDKLNTARVDFQRDLNSDKAFKSVDFGFNVSDRKKTRQYVEGRLVIIGGDPLGSMDVPGSGTTTLGGISFATFNPVGTIGSIYAVAAKQHPDIFNKDWQVNEKLYTAFAKAKIDTVGFGGLPIRGNLGLQIIETNQDSNAFDVDNRTCANDVCQSGRATQAASYHDVLPSLNLAMELRNDQVLRFALARQMARPTLNDMRASFSFSLDSQNDVLTGSGGNPQLRPFRANAVDITYEKYFGKKAYFATQLFYKDLATYVIQQVDFAYDFGPFISQGTVLPTTGSTTGIFTHPVNGHGGKMEGVEFALSLPFEMLTSALEGFGVQGNFALTSSAVKLPITGFNFDSGSGLTPTIPLPGFSKHVSDVTLYFERWGFAARVTQSQRSDFIGEVTSFTGDRQLSFIKGEKVMDAQLSYEIKSGPVKGLQIQLQGQNMTNQPFVRYRSDNSEIERTKYGKTYLLGVNYRL
jgi:iron complex outermembrane receptor protein